VASVMTSGIYTIPAWGERVTFLSKPVQTEKGPTRTIGLCNGVADVSNNDRTLELSLSLPTPVSFPPLTSIQLYEAEKQLQLLLSRLEIESSRATEEERIKGLADGQDSTQSSFISQAAWNERMRRSVEGRLCARYGRGRAAQQWIKQTQTIHGGGNSRLDSSR
jgi:hypothetical protein